MEEELEFLDNVWFPIFLEDLFKTEKVKEVWNQAVITEDLKERADIIGRISKTIDEAYNAKKKEIGL